MKLFLLAKLGDNILLSFVNVALYTTSQEEGRRLSPISIDKKTAITENAGPLEWSPGYTQPPKSISLIDDGTTFKLTCVPIEPMIVSGGMLRVGYEFQHLIFHWGSDGTKGSEHIVDGKSYPLEMQLIHTRVAPKSNTDEFLIVSYFFKSGKKHNDGLKRLLEMAPATAKKKNTPMNIRVFTLSELMNAKHFPYFTYKGSLTLPPYTESATWIVCSNPLHISELQLRMFRKCAEIDKSLCNNFREPQALFDRRITFVPKSKSQ